MKLVNLILYFICNTHTHRHTQTYMCMLTRRHKPASHPPCTDPIGQDQPMEFCCLWGPVGGIQALAILLRRESLPIYILPLLSLSWPKSCIRATTLSKAGCLVFCTLPFFFFSDEGGGKRMRLQSGGAHGCR